MGDYSVYEDTLKALALTTKPPHTHQMHRDPEGITENGFMLKVKIKILFLSVSGVKLWKQTHTCECESVMI